MKDIKEIVGAVAFEAGVQLSFRISRTELERNTPEQLGHLLLEKIEWAREHKAQIDATQSVAKDA